MVLLENGLFSSKNLKKFHFSSIRTSMLFWRSWPFYSPKSHITNIGTDYTAKIVLDKKRAFFVLRCAVFIIYYLYLFLFHIIIIVLSESCLNSNIYHDGLPVWDPLWWAQLRYCLSSPPRRKKNRKMWHKVSNYSVSLCTSLK